MYQILHFGAGNIGKCFVGELIFKQKIALNFADVNAEILKAINQGIKIKYLNNKQEILIPVSKTFCLKNQKQEIVNFLADCDYLTTSIGVDNLVYLVPLIVESLKLRNKINSLVIICFENAYKASQTLVELTKKELNSSLVQKLSYINVVVDRIVPSQKTTNEVIVDNYCLVSYKKLNNFYPFTKDKTVNVQVDNYPSL